MDIFKLLLICNKYLGVVILYNYQLNMFLFVLYSCHICAMSDFSQEEKGRFTFL